MKKIDKEDIKMILFLIISILFIIIFESVIICFITTLIKSNWFENNCYLIITGSVILTLFFIIRNKLK